jgi:hypothetical protein
VSAGGGVDGLKGLTAANGDGGSYGVVKKKYVA